MKYILEIILTIIIIFFLWNILKRMFFSAFYKFPRPDQQNEATHRKTKKSVDAKINWDAETVDYEEIKDTNEKKQ